MDKRSGTCGVGTDDVVGCKRTHERAQTTDHDSDDEDSRWGDKVRLTDEGADESGGAGGASQTEPGPPPDEERMDTDEGRSEREGGGQRGGNVRQAALTAEERARVHEVAECFHSIYDTYALREAMEVMAETYSQMCQRHQPDHGRPRASNQRRLQRIEDRLRAFENMVEQVLSVVQRVHDLTVNLNARFNRLSSRLDRVEDVLFGVGGDASAPTACHHASSVAPEPDRAMKFAEDVVRHCARTASGGAVRAEGKAHGEASQRGQNLYRAHQLEELSGRMSQLSIEYVRLTNLCAAMQRELVMLQEQTCAVGPGESLLANREEYVRSLQMSSEAEEDEKPPRSRDGRRDCTEVPGVVHMVQDELFPGLMDDELYHHRGGNAFSSCPGKNFATHCESLMSMPSNDIKHPLPPVPRGSRGFSVGGDVDFESPPVPAHVSPPRHCAPHEALDFSSVEPMAGCEDSEHRTARASPPSGEYRHGRVRVKQEPEEEENSLSMSFGESPKFHEIEHVYESVDSMGEGARV